MAHADVMGCDGRTRRCASGAGLESKDVGAPIDVLWFRLPRRPPIAKRPSAGSSRRMLVMLDRGDYWQCAYVIAKGGIDAVQATGPAGVPRRIARDAPSRDRVGEMQSWDDVKLLTVPIDRLRAMAPAGAALHRRRRACDVAGRRRRYQPGDS